jgi:hypothetical protein
MDIEQSMATVDEEEEEGVSGNEVMRLLTAHFGKGEQADQVAGETHDPQSRSASTACCILSDECHRK